MPLKQHKGAGATPLSAVTLKGKISWFGGPNDSTSGPTTASGAPVTTPGIAVYNHATLGGYWRVTTPNGRTHVVQQTDIGPAPWTGRLIDFTYSALRLFGYTESNFPTNATAHAEYLGKDKQSAMEKAGNAVAASQGVTSGGETGSTQNVSLLGNAESLLGIGKDLLTGNVGALGGKLAMLGLTIIKDAGVGFADLIIAPAWHWNQRATAYYAAYVLDPKKVAEQGEYQWAFAWTAAFWGMGYVLFFTEPGSGNLKVAPVHKSRVAHHVRNLQAVPARRSLVKPSEVKEKTPTKPKPKISTAYITQTGTMSTTRPRQVKVHGTRDTGGTESTVPVKREGTGRETDLQRRIRERITPKPHADNRTGQGALRNKRVSPAPVTEKRRRTGHRA